VNRYTQPRFLVTLGIVIVGLILAQQFWQWEIERVEVEKGNYLVRISRWGKDLPEGEIVAPDETYKGVMAEPSGDGRYFLNPLFWGHEIHKLVNVPTGKCLVLTRKYGREIDKERLAEGDILAGENDRGIVAEPLGPGGYRLNPYAYTWEMFDQIKIGADQVGVRTLKVGKDPRTLMADASRPLYVVPDGYRGVQQTVVPNGDYYINPYRETVTPVEVRSHRAELTDIEFPSRDGFILKPRVMVEYQVQRDKAPEVLIRLSDEGKLHQGDGTQHEQDENEILQKVLLPHMRGYARIEGSNFDARDFIITTTDSPTAKASNTRERLQKALLAKVGPRCRELGIEIRAVLLGEMKPPPELADQISQRDLARVMQEQNKSLMGQYKEQQKLAAVTALKAQNTAKVAADTRLLVMQTQVEQQKLVEELKLKQELENAKIRLEAARSRADSILLKGKADAAVIQTQNEAEVAGLRKAAQGFGNVGNFAQYEILKQIAPALREIFASDESEFGRLFAGYMTPAPVVPGTNPPRLAIMPREAEVPGTKTAENNHK
jgi:hypothetical protein